MTLVTDIMLIIATCLTGVVAGAEAATLIIHKTVDQLDFTPGRVAAQAINKKVGSLMPIVMPATVIAALVCAFLVLGTASSILLFVAAVALVMMLVITFVGLAPLNAREEAATGETPIAEWHALRARWMRLHSLRVVCDALALILVACAVTLH